MTAVPVRLTLDLAEWNEPRLLQTPISPEHNYHDLGAGMLIDELLGTIDQVLGEYEG